MQTLKDILKCVGVFTILVVLAFWARDGGRHNHHRLVVEVWPTNTTAEINAKIQSCPSNGIVKFHPGVYRIGAEMKNGVVLRGANLPGHGQDTWLIFTNDSWWVTPAP